MRLKDGYDLAPVLFTAIVAPPGSAKSPALDAARRPLDTLQAEATLRYQDARRAESADPDRAGERPRLEHLFTTDSTTEALAAMLTASPGLVIVRDELGGWVAGFDACPGGRGGDRQAWLSLWTGSPLEVDRKAAEPIFIPTPVVCVCGGVQPDLLPQFAGEARQRDGFVERLLQKIPQRHCQGGGPTPPPPPFPRQAGIFGLARFDSSRWPLLYCGRFGPV